MKNIFIYTLLFALLNACIPLSRPNEDIVLEIGGFSMSHDEYNYQIEKLKKSTKQDSIQSHKQLIDEAYILAFAKQNRFDTVAELKKRLEYAMKFYISQVDGYLWNKTIKPKIEITNLMSQEAYQRKKQNYQFEIIHLRDTSISVKQYNTIDMRKFDKLKKISLPDKFYTLTLSYPFLPYGAFTDELDHAKINDIIGPFQTDQGTYIMRVGNTLSTTVPPFNEIQNTIHQELTMKMIQKYVWQSVQRIKSETSPIYYEAAISDICNQYDEFAKDWNSQVDSLLLLEYTLHKQKKHLRGKDFREFIRYQPMFIGSLKNEGDVKKIIESYLINQYLYDETQKLSPDSDPQYVLFKDWLKNQFYLKYFKEKHVDANIDIQESAIARYYESRKDSLKTFERADITIYQFKTLSEAMSYKQQRYGPNNQLEKRLEPTKQHLTFHRNGKNTYDTSIEQNIEGLKLSALSNPIKINDQYCLLEIKDTVGAVYIAYDQIKEKLRQELYLEKEKKVYTKQLENLKSLYKIKINKTI